MTSAGESAGLIASAIQNWYAEKSNYNFATGVCGSGQCGHYTQVSDIIMKYAQINHYMFACAPGPWPDCMGSKLPSRMRQ